MRTLLVPRPPGNTGAHRFLDLRRPRQAMGIVNRADRPHGVLDQVGVLHVYDGKSSVLSLLKGAICHPGHEVNDGFACTLRV